MRQSESVGWHRVKGGRFMGRIGAVPAQVDKTKGGQKSMQEKESCALWDRQEGT